MQAVTAIQRRMNLFIDKTKENEQFNQYWYSPHTIAIIVKEVMGNIARTGRVACVSTPSIYFTLKQEVDTPECFLFDVRTYIMYVLYYTAALFFSWYLCCESHNDSNTV